MSCADKQACLSVSAIRTIIIFIWNNKGLVGDPSPPSPFTSKELRLGFHGRNPLPTPEDVGAVPSQEVTLASFPDAHTSFFPLLFSSSLLTAFSRHKAFCNSLLGISYRKTTNYSQESIFQIHTHTHTSCNVGCKQMGNFLICPLRTEAGTEGPALRCCQEQNSLTKFSFPASQLAEMQ